MNLWKTKFEPMLLDEIDKPFNSNDYIFELKFDGIRALIYISKSEFKIINRHQKDITYLYPELKQLQNTIDGKVIFDGEIICMENGLPSFSKIQKRSNIKDKEKIENQVKNNPVTFICFDILYQNKDLTKYSLLRRKEILNKYDSNDFFVKIKYIENTGIKFFQKIKKQSLEGIVAKLKTSKYEINTRSKDWIKIKNFQQEEFLIGGYIFKEDSHVFSVLLGENKNNQFKFVGRVFISKKNKLFDLLKKEKQIKSKFNNYQDESVTYVNPKYPCKVKYIERTENNNLRQPFYVEN